ncbi:prephenate dehydrogenase/arogenate dehydrogenase family protein [Wenzhouxiangella sp. EGI_FJ10305]|uniref:prephenate dehydrogenase/arogenate dehydrogenase family protein n=1 Tax=Wenzhouxiangella sp. EGI_FJ10305 TaxID=3243768 RepID=UPI0035DA7C1C
MDDPELAQQLKALRDELDGVDADLIELATRRQKLVSDIGRIKKSHGRQLRDFRREREVLDGVRRAAESKGLDPGLAEDLFQRLIEASLTRQEQERLRLAGHGHGQRALVIGGGGRMGRWLAAFLDGQGFDVLIADPAVESDGRTRFSDWREAPTNVALIVIAAPLRISADVLAELARQPVDALVFDIGSLKSPLLPALRAAADAGLRACSIHPMFGPDTQLLSDKHVLVMDVGCSEAVEAVKSLFVETLADVVVIELDEHDRLMAPVLGLSHALSIVFFTALADCGVEADRLSKLSSTTFDRQLAIARAVAAENPDLYFEIQSLNRHGAGARRALLVAVQTLIESIENDDVEAFRQLMARGRGYLSDLE